MTRLWMMLAPLAIADLIIDILISDSTEEYFFSTIANVITENLNNPQVFSIFVRKETDIKSLLHTNSIVIDATFSLSITAVIKQAAEDSQFVYLNIGEPTHIFSDWEFFVHFDHDQNIKALSQIFNLLNWTTALIVKENNYDDLSSALIESFANFNIQYFSFIDNQSQTVSDLFVGREILPTGVKNIVIQNSGNGAQKIVNSLETKDLYQKGTGVIIGSRGIWGADADGLLIYVESELEDAADYAHYEALACLKMLKIIDALSITVSNIELKEKLQSVTYEHQPIFNYSLINIKSSQKVKVGHIFDEELFLNKTLMFPGNTTKIPNTFVSYVNISMADGRTNPGTSSSWFYPALKAAARMAVNLANEQNYLGNFQIAVTHTDCGAESFTTSYSVPCFAALKNQMGVAHLTSGFPLACYGTIQAFRALKISIPMISELCGETIFNNQTTYPEFMRVMKNYGYNSSMMANLALIFGWTNVIILYQNSTTGIDLYNYFLKSAQSSNINILNNETSRIIKNGYDKADFETYKPLFESIKNTKGRIFIMLIDPPSVYYVIEGLYDVGIRRGDAIMMFSIKVSFEIALETDPQAKLKLAELMYGSFAVFQDEWVGDYGLYLKDLYVRLMNSVDPVYKCFAYDSMMTVLNAIKFSIAKGDNINTPSVINKSMRLQRFTGCSGTVTFANGSNDRSQVVIVIYNTIYNSTNGKWIDIRVGTYNIASTHPFTFISSITWPGGTSGPPSDIIVKPDDCPFDWKDVQSSFQGTAIFYTISFTIAAGTALLSIYIFRKWWNVYVGPLLVKKNFKFGDGIVMSIIFIDFLQLIAMGPTMSGYDKFSSVIGDYASVNLTNIIEFKEKYYWMGFFTVLGLCTLWVYFCVIILYQIGDRFQNWFIDHSVTMARETMPILGNLCVIPIVSILLDVFNCRNATGGALSDSFIGKDCTMTCWNYPHNLYASLALISLLSYVPLAVYCRPIWQNLQLEINIITRPLHLMTKSIIQVTIVVLKGTLKPYNQSLHGLVFLFILAIYLVICIKWKPFNYHRCNWWTIISILAVMWSVLLSSIYWIVPSGFVSLWIILQLTGWFILLLLGIFVQHKWYPSLLYREKAPDIGIFFRFLLSSNVKVDEITKIKKKNENDSPGLPKVSSESRSEDNLIARDMKFQFTLRTNMVSTMLQ
ncbi:unnamed protein product [Blepharisma stoltei]|uniref:Receptor ligand binding region domain-containing protein n=1 Tax=Blepharisma stoltei TaxID=1481888 RepID=A0AAU9JMU9_9CILI|nr:unnamed protein product [Blepharisma stoltei]